MFRNLINAVRNLARAKAAAVAAVGGVAGSAFAAGGPDFSGLTGAVDFSTLVAAVIAIGANVLLVYVAFKGAKIIISAVKGM